MKILMVCLGNICRSPMAEGILKDKIEKQHLKDKIFVDSAGFEPSHLNEAPDMRAQKCALQHGIDISGQRQRLFRTEDFDIFDRIFVMDSNNYRDVQRKSRTEKDMAKVAYLMNLVYPNENRIVPDPWYGNMNDFEESFQLIDQACEILVTELKG